MTARGIPTDVRDAIDNIWGDTVPLSTSPEYYFDWRFFRAAGTPGTIGQLYFGTALPARSGWALGMAF